MNHDVSLWHWQELFRDAPAERVLCVAGDVDRDGQEELIVAGRRQAEGLFWLDRDSSGRWQKHLIDDAYESLDAGGVLFDINGDGRLDFIAGGDWRSNLLYWWEAPEDPRKRWTRRPIAIMPGNQSHDQIVADLDGDGRAEVYFWNQGGRTLFAAPIPDDPRVAPWPDVRPVVRDVKEEGLAVGDVDGDGKPELVAGQSWYKWDGRAYQRHEYTRGFVSPRVALADFDGDGILEIALAEGDASFAKPGPGSIAIFHRPQSPTALWQPQVLREDLIDPHSILVHDFDGDGRPELFVGELGDPNGNNPHPPGQRIFALRDGRWSEQLIAQGIATHEAKLLTIDGQCGIVSKPYRNLNARAPREQWVDAIGLWTPSFK